MNKYIRIGVFLLLVFLLLNLSAAICFKMQLRGNLVRLHVVANSDEEQDQNLKLKVKDAIVDYLQLQIASCDDQTQAKQLIKENLLDIQHLAEKTLMQSNCSMPVTVSLCSESFPTRQYDTFTLPAGVYESLRVKIGSAEGKNWWCVVFPALCIPATADGFEEKAVSCGFQTSLVETLKEPGEYKLRFFFLEQIGVVENFLTRK